MISLFKLIDPIIHDYQHLLASFAGGIVGINIFLIYYFFSRIESQDYHNNQIAHEIKSSYYSWQMPWYYFFMGIFLFACVGAAIACLLSASVRPRIIYATKLPENYKL